jgi:hypothetical protein
MKYLAWALIIIGLAAILFGIESCRNVREFYSASQVKDLRMNSEGDPVAMASAEKFISVIGGGIIMFFTGLYLRSWARPDSAIWRSAEYLTIRRLRFCPKCGRPLRAGECKNDMLFGTFPRLLCGDCNVAVERSGMLIFVIGFFLILIGFLDPDSVGFFVLPGLPMCLLGLLQWNNQLRKARQYLSKHSTSRTPPQ